MEIPPPALYNPVLVYDHAYCNFFKITSHCNFPQCISCPLCHLLVAHLQSLSLSFLDSISKSCCITEIGVFLFAPNFQSTGKAKVVQKV